MYVAAPPRVASQPSTADGWRTAGPYLSRVDARVYAHDSAEATHPELRRFLGDMVAPYALPLRDDVFQRGLGQSYGEMAEQLIRDTVDARTPLDLVLLAHAVPDVIPGRATACYLSDICPGEPLAFAVCDQGSAVGFAALGIAGTYHSSGGCPRALVLVLEQSALHYDAPGATLPQHHAAVALQLGPDGPARIAELVQHAGVAAAVLAGVLLRELDRLAADRDGVTTLLGSGLGPSLMDGLPGHVRQVPPGQPCTGVWSALAEGMRGWAQGRRVLIADYEPALGYLSVAAIDVTYPDQGAP
jgi:4-hydroxymandelate oxidase